MSDTPSAAEAVSDTFVVGPTVAVNSPKLSMYTTTATWCDACKKSLPQLAAIRAAFGARPIKRMIQMQLQNPLATELLKEEYPEGSEVHIDVADGKFVIEVVDRRADGEQAGADGDQAGTGRGES